MMTCVIIFSYRIYVLSQNNLDDYENKKYMERIKD